MLSQINLVVRDMAAALAFYRRLGLTIVSEPDAVHAAVAMPSGMLLEFDTTEFVPSWDSGWRGATGGSTVIGFAIPSREGVDALYADLTQAGYHGRQPPFDAFWGARYAIVDDPDGNGAGLMSPIDPQRKYWPPNPPPAT